MQTNKIIDAVVIKAFLFKMLFSIISIPLLLTSFLRFFSLFENKLPLFCEVPENTLKNPLLSPWPTFLKFSGDRKVIIGLLYSPCV